MTQTAKQADIRYRTEIKRNGIVVYTVRSSDDTKDYEVTVVRGKVNNCTCKATKPCYHMRDVQAREDERKMQEPFASRLHNGVTLEKYNADVERENSEASLDRRIAEREPYLPPLHSSKGFQLLK
jgi:hypothetical protein